MKEKNLGFYEQFMWVLKFNKKEEDAAEVQRKMGDQAWQKKVRQEYDQQVNKKKAEIQNFQKQSLKDSIRIGYVELAEINLKFGFA
jgi:hypothetical protein